MLRRRLTLGLLFSSTASHAAWLPQRLGLPETRVLRRSASAGGVVNPEHALQAVCDHRSKRCRVTAQPASRRAHLTMQQVDCENVDSKTATDMPKTYVPGEVEERLYKWWEESGFFKPAADNGKQCFVISMPPPNVTGKLHMGHAMFVALEDIMARFHRMRGHPTLWLPGTDHAGIATQMLVERSLKADGISRQQIGREAFLGRVWDWKTEYGGYITSQIRRLGASCDWSREKFTLDPELCDAVTEAFLTLHDRGLIYKGEYMVNWSPELGTAVSDLEVDYSEEEGKLYYFKYKFSDSDEYIPVATTRPETIIGDEAVCVHPEDERFASFVGKMVQVPLMNREVPVIADEYVKRDFGTGALKITPAHDINDYAIGKRHGLRLTNIMNKDATINALGGAYESLDRFECRQKIWQDMEAAGLTIKVDKHIQRVPRSSRSGEVIEPMISSQWFVKMDSMAAKGLDAVRSGDITILPERFNKVYFNWLENIQDWCISRQLWWGHRIPVWYAIGTDKYFVGRNEADARAKAEAELGKDVVLVQDEDVLDTWFSSGLWPFATVGWPNDTEEFQRFYPSSIMETGYDILFFWVARMIMLGIEFTGKSPFHTVYMHGLVRDAQGQKMSKTKGNVVDPIETIETFGTDALRLSLVTGVTPGQDVPLSMEKVESNRNFANKLWNTARYIIMGLHELGEEERAELAVTSSMGADDMAKLDLPERWILSQCHSLVHTVTRQLQDNDFGPAGQAIYSFLWDEFADWYLEISKQRMSSSDASVRYNARRTLVYVFDTCLRLLHPFMPFVTEELWQRLPHVGQSLMIADWPQQEDALLPIDSSATREFASMQALIRSVRNARAEYRVEPSKLVAATVVANPRVLHVLQSEAEAIALLARISPDQLEWQTNEDSYLESGAVRLIADEMVEAYLPLSTMVDAAKERVRLGKQQAKLELAIEKLTQRLASPGFVDKAPSHVLEKARSDLQENSEQLQSVLAALEELPSD